MSGRVKKLLHLRISTIILLFWGIIPPGTKIFFRLANARHNYPPTCKYESAPLGSAPDPAAGAYSAPPEPLAGFKGPYF